MDEVLHRMVQMCLSLSSLLRCWVYPLDLSDQGDHSTEVSDEVCYPVEVVLNKLGLYRAVKYDTCGSECSL